jgi:predicted transcriptional regulator
MNKNLLFDQITVKDTQKLLSILSRRDNLSIFMGAAAEKGLNADLSTPQLLGIAKKTYYTRLKQLIKVGLIRKHERTYIHTTLGDVVYQKQFELMQQIKNIKHFKMIDALKDSKEFSDEDIRGFVGKVISENITSVHDSHNNVHVDIFWEYEEMVSAIIQRIELCKEEILLASKYTNELIINSMLHKVQTGVKAKVISDKSLVKKFFDQNMVERRDKNTLERNKVVGNPWYPGNIERRSTDLPFSMILLDRKEVGIELIHANDPKTFNGVIFIRDEKIANLMVSFYEKVWETSSSDDLSGASASNRYVTPFSNSTRSLD